MTPLAGTFAYWFRNCWPEVWRPMLPSRWVQDEPPPGVEAPDGSGGVFCQRRNAIWLRPANNTIVVNAHEYGHWFFWRLMRLANALWELPWHGLRLGNLFVRDRSYRVPPR